MPIIEKTRSVLGGLGRGGEQVASGLYDFAVDGGVVGDIVLRGDAAIPAGAIIVDAGLNVETIPTSGGAATIAVKVESAADIQSAAAISGAPWSTATPKRTTFTATTAPIKTTVARTVTITVATAALTAGKLTVWVKYVAL